MNSSVIRCPNCGKPIVTVSDLLVFPCPYCGSEVDAERQRNELISLEVKEKRKVIRKMIEDGDYDGAREASFDAASSLDAKAVFLACVLECDLLRHHPFFFNPQTIEADVGELLSAKDFSELPADELTNIRRSSQRGLKLFYERASECLNHYGSFVGERYDAVSRFVYAGMCCLSLKKIGAELESFAKDCVGIISNVCSGSFGDVYNMPSEIFQAAEEVVDSLSREFRFSASLRLQSNPHMTDAPVSKKLICPICGEALPKIDKGQYMTCPACRHRVSRETIRNASLCAGPISYQDKLERCIIKDDLQGAEEALLFLRKQEPSNPNYAMAELIVRRNDITPLRLGLRGYPELLRLASSAKAEAFQEQMRNVAEHFKMIRSILCEASSRPHGPSQELIEALDQFLNQFVEYGGM
ncbi:MAG: hypothetical protein IJ787_06920 [Bacilli bacterium]|nr:hypothetical protein [Bacilli bacterium]